MNQKQIQQLDLLLSQIRINTIELYEEDPTKGQLLRTGICKSSKLLRGIICDDDVIDIGAIGLTLLIKEHEHD